MKKLYSIISAGAFLLAASLPSYGSSLLFSTDMSPIEDDLANYNEQDHPPGWGGAFGQESGSYPELVWQNDSNRAASGSNGFFIEGRRAGEDPDQAFLRSGGISLREQDRNGLDDFEISFNFKIGSDPDFNDGNNSGILDFRFQQWNDGWQDTNLKLFDGGIGTVGDEGVELENNFDSLTVTDAGNGWRNVTVTGAFVTGDDDGLLWFEPWSAAGGAAQFTGSYGVDNVSLTAVPEPSTYAMIVGFLALGGCLLRRRFRRNG